MGVHGQGTEESFAALWQELDRERQAKGWTRGRLARRASQLSHQVYAEKTLHDRMTQGRRVPWDQGVWIVRALELDEQLWQRRWAHASAARHRDRSDPQPRAASPPTSPPTLQRERQGRQFDTRMLVLSFGGALIVSTVAVVLTFLLPSIRGFFASPPGIEVRISNTSTEGVSYRLGPSPSFGRTGGVAEGAVVRVVCQVRNGAPVTDVDNPTPDQPANYRVWNKTDEGLYFSDLWSDLPKNRSSGLPDC